MPMLWTKSPGTGGRVERSGDFRVDELLDKKAGRSFQRTGHGVSEVSGPYVLFCLEKKNMTTERALREISRELSVPLNRIGYAGLKDRSAVTVQYLTVREDLLGAKRSVELKNTETSLSLKPEGKSGKMLSAGDLEGNRFDITLRRCDRPGNVDRVVEEIRKRGVPNYFGPQRFGSSGRNHVVGRLLVDGEFAAAAEELRDMYNVPGIRGAGKRRLKFLVNAYQSHLFNQELEKYVKSRKTPTSRKIKVRGFSLDGLRISCRGFERNMFVHPRGIRARRSEDSVSLSFELPAGSYATVLLAEVAKQKVTR